MLALLFLAALFASISALSCPPDYQLMEGDRCIRPLMLWENDAISNLRIVSAYECGMHDAHLPIIRSAEENDAFNRIANSFDEIKGWNIKLVLDLVCNSTSHQLEWVDGTSVDYSPYPGLDLSVDCTNTTAISELKRNAWSLVSVDDLWSYTVLCVTEPSDKVYTTTAKQPTSSSCPEQYQLMEGDRCVRPLFLWENNILDYIRPVTAFECGRDGAHLPIIKNDEDNDAFNRIANSFDAIKGWNIRLVMDLVCNSLTHRLEWVDGTPVDYIPDPKLDLSFDCSNSSTVSDAKHGGWLRVSTDDAWSYTVLCVTEPNQK